MILTRKIGLLILTTIIFSLRTIAQGEFYQVSFELYKSPFNEGFSDIIRANHESGGNPLIDNSDLPKLNFGNGERFALLRNQQDLGIETRPLVNCTDTLFIRLYNTPTATTNFRIVVDMFNYPVIPGLTAVMQDRFLNTERSIKFGDTTHINFQITSNVNTTGQRFRVVFRRTQVTTAPFTQIPPICRGEALQLPVVSSNGVIGSWTPAVNNTQTTTYTFKPSEGQCATSPSMTIGVTTTQAVTPTFTPIAPICRGGSITLPSSSDNNYTGSWSPAVNNTETTNYTFSPTTGQCATETTLNVVVNPNPSVTVNSPVVCSGAIATVTAIPGVAGTYAYEWTVPAGVANPGNVSSFTTTTAGTYRVVITNTATNCKSLSASGIVTVNQPITPTFNQISPICSGGTITLPGTSNNNIAGTWTPAINNTQTTTYTFTPTAGQCATTTTMQVVVNPPVTPTFTQVSPICNGGTFTLPTTSNNSITGTWSPAINNKQTTTYTFTPASGQCATTTTMQVVVNPPVTPAFTQVSSICNGGTFTLPTTSNNSITGTWSPAINNIQTTTYTFTPTLGQCATTTTMTVEVNPFLRPVINCGINTPNSVEFVWSAIKGATGYEINYVINGGNTPVTVSIDSLQYVISNLNTGDEVTITILPIGGMGTCFQSDTKMCKTITCSSVDAGTISGVQEVCIENTTVFVPAVSGGSWSTTDSSIATVNSNGVVRGIGAGTTTITYRILNSTPGCADGIATRTVTVNQPITPTFTQVSPICAGSTITLPTTSNNSISGSWLPAIDNTKTTTYTFTPSQGQCAITTTMTVTVNQPITTTFTQVSPICNGGTFTLTTTSNNSITGTWSPDINNTQTTTYTFTPTQGQCATTTTMTVEVNQPVTPTFNQIGPFNSGTNFILPNTSNNGIIGSWTPAINNTETTTYTFSPDPNQCANTTQVTVAINFPTSLSDLNSGKDLIIYPNPVDRGSGTVLFELGNFSPGRYQLSVYALNGIRLKEISLQHGGGTSNYRLSMDQSWSPGMYLIVISGENFFKAQKILFIK